MAHPPCSACRLGRSPHEARKPLAGVLVPACGLVDGEALVGHAIVVAVTACKREQNRSGAERMNS